MINQKISTQEQGSGSFIIYDCTGKYSSTNPGGYDPPSYKLSSIQSDVIYIMPPSKSEYLDGIDVTGALASYDGNIGFQVFPSMVGMIGSLESGQWKFKRVTQFSTSSAIKTVTSYHTDVFIGSIKCCIEKKAESVTSEAFSMSRMSVEEKKATELATLLFIVENYQIPRGLYDQAGRTIDYLSSQCKCSGC